jgi:hypothetical protein
MKGVSSRSAQGKEGKTKTNSNLTGERSSRFARRRFVNVPEAREGFRLLQIQPIIWRIAFPRLEDFHALAARCGFRMSSQELVPMQRRVAIAYVLTALFGAQIFSAPAWGQTQTPHPFVLWSQGPCTIPFSSLVSDADAAGVSEEIWSPSPKLSKTQRSTSASLGAPGKPARASTSYHELRPLLPRR